MKNIFVILAILTLTSTSGVCKPGGWLFDILDRSSITIGPGYQQPQCYNQSVYYRPAPVYYRPAPVYYPNNSFEFRGNRGYHHCR